MLSEAMRTTTVETPEPVFAIEPITNYVVISVSIGAGNYEIALSGNGIRASVSGTSPDVYLPESDVIPQVLVPSSMTRQCPALGLVRYFHLDLWGHRFENIAWSCASDSVLGGPRTRLNQRIAFDTNRVTITEM